MSTQPLICPQCGAEIPPGAARCPYCGTAYAPGAEKEYMRKLHGVRNDLGRVAGVGAEVTRRESGRLARKIALTVGVILVIAAVIFGIVILHRAKERSDNRKEYQWQRQEFPEMNTLFESGDYDALLEKYDKAQEDGHAVWDWEHRTFCELYEDTLYAASYRDGYEKGYFTRDDAVNYLYHLLKFRGLSMRNDAPADDRKALQPFLEPFENDLEEIYGADAADLESFDRTLSKNYGWPDYDACEEYVSAHPELIRE